MVHAVSALFALLLLAVPAFASETFFVGPSGSDQAAGRSADQPWKTIDHALRETTGLPASDSVVIQVAPGTYSGQRSRIEWPAASPAIAIKPLDPRQRPVFDGDGRGTWLMIIAPGASRRLRLSISGLDIRSYQGAISLNGDKFDASVSLADARIANNRFENIGSQEPGQKPSTAALRLVNARSVKIENNEFLNISNIESCNHLHSIYLAHGSSNNLIRQNRFSGGCGATVKLRDESNDNQIIENRFVNQSREVIQDAFCDRSKRPVDCSKQECPSWQNVFTGNEYRGIARPVRIVGPDAPPTCPQPGGRRRVLSGGGPSTR